MSVFTDQMGRTIELRSTPKRIISLVPSQTELLFDLGLEEEVVGITKFCIRPETWFRSKARIGGTKTVSLEKIKALNPDLIIANKEENVQEQVEALAKEFPVWISDINTLPEAISMIEKVAAVVGKKAEGEALCVKIQTAFYTFQPSNAKPRAAYLIWKNPYMSVGNDTFIHDMLDRAGFENILSHKTRYPEILIEELASLNCEVLLLSSEPYPFKQADIDELQVQLPNTRIELVDGELFSWYGSRLLQAPAYFQGLLEKFNTIT
ncbi:MAG: iron transporter [Flaviaesturariibacter sp.]|nr:iron transporter [Flaviaesturariibacter sp.]